MLQDEHKKKLQKFEFVLIIALVIVVPLIIIQTLTGQNNTITGFVASDTKAQILNMAFTDSQALNLKSVSSEPVYISSFSVSGEVIGDGSIAIYLANGGKRSLVYTNAGQSKKSSPITGMATGIGAAHAVAVEQNNVSLMIEEGRKLTWPGSLGGNPVSGSFTAVCIDSCYLNANEFTANNFELQVFVEPGTAFKLQEVLYTIG